MAAIVLKTLAGAIDAPQMLVDAAQAVTSIMDTVREEARKIAEQNRQDDNDFNIRKNFLENAVAAINNLLQGQYNIMLLTDQEKDIEWGGPLKGRLLPMDLVEVEVGGGRKVNFQVMVFDEGKYLRKGKWEEDSISWYPDSAKMWKDVNMHIEFSPQPKKSTDGVPTRDELKKKDEEKLAIDDAATKKPDDDKKAADEAAAKQSTATEGNTSAESGQKSAEDNGGTDPHGEEAAGTSYGKGSKGTVTNAASHIGKNGARSEDNEKAIEQGGRPDIKGKKTTTDNQEAKDEEQNSDEEEGNDGKVPDACLSNSKKTNPRRCDKFLVKFM